MYRILFLFLLLPLWSVADVNLPSDYVGIEIYQSTIDDVSKNSVNLYFKVSHMVTMKMVIVMFLIMVFMRFLVQVQWELNPLLPE